MSAVLGFEFYQGPEVPPPAPIDHTLPPFGLARRQAEWLIELTHAIQDHDPWAILITYPDGIIELFDLSISSLQAAVQRGFTAHLLLAKEARR